MASERKGSISGAADGLLETAFFRSGERSFSGYAVDAGDPTRKFVIELLVDGHSVAAAVADRYVDDLAKRGIGDARFGFSFSIHPKLAADMAVAEARLANRGIAVGSPVVASDPDRNGHAADDAGSLKWLGGLRFLASSRGKGPESDVADVQVDGEPILRVRANSWMQIGAPPEEARAVRAFDFHLPDRFADGTVHRVGISDVSGTPFSGSPHPFVAFADGLAHTIAALGTIDSEKLRGELFDSLLPQSIPLSRYDAWVDRFPLPRPPASRLHAAVVAVGPGDMEETLASLEDQSHAQWVAAALPPAEPEMKFQPELLSAFLDDQGAECEFVVFGLSGMLLRPDALLRIAAAFEQHPAAQAVYGDIDYAGKDGSIWPTALPAFDLERVLEQGYCAHAFALRRSAATGAARAGADSLYRLFNMMLDGGNVGDGEVVHLPGAIATLPAFDRKEASALLAEATRAHLACRQVPASVEPRPGFLFPAAQVTRQGGAATTTIIIPTRNRHALLRRCVESIRPAVTALGAEIMVVDNDSSEPESREYLAELDGGVAQVLRVAGPFNFARLNNRAVEAARGEYVCLLNNDIEAVDQTWLAEMIGRMAGPDVGAVGALLLWPSGVVQHGGVVLGPNFAAAHAFNDRVSGDPGYGDLLNVAHECSAVTAACMLTRRDDYLKVGGMDELRLPVNFNDVDYCLKLRALGRRIVFTPRARLLHLESATRGKDDEPDRAARFERELRTLRARWGDDLLDDPYYSPVLSRDPIPFSALAWPPRPMHPRTRRRPVAAELPPGF